MAYKVLVPLDGSRLAECSLAYLKALKPVGDLQLLLFSVASPEWATSSGPLGAGTQEPETGHQSDYLSRVSSSLKDTLGTEVLTKVGHGPVAGTILEEATAYEPDLIVISTHGRSGLSRWRLGSVADKLIRSAESNVLVIGPQSGGQEALPEAGITPSFDSVLIPLDGSSLAEQALTLAHWFIERLGAVVHLVRAVPLPDNEDLDRDASAAMVMEAPMVTHARTLAAGLLTDAGEYLSRVASELGSGVQTAVLTGPPAAEIHAYATEKGIDLIVMTSHGRGGFVRTALGSVTDRLIGTSIPVLVVRSRQGEA